MSAADVILACPKEATSWPMRELLMSQPRWGTKRCRTFLERNQIGELKPVGDLTDRQKHVVAKELNAISGSSALAAIAGSALQVV